jgi:hypothetical protein
MYVLRRLLHFVCLSLVIIIIAAAFPQVAYWHVQCAGSAQCTMMHCNCCGPNCPMAAHSHEPEKHNGDCSRQCPLMAQSQSVLISNPRSVAVAMLTVCQLEPLPFTCIFSRVASLPASRGSPSPTLLSLACALTI